MTTQQETPQGYLEWWFCPDCGVEVDTDGWLCECHVPDEGVEPDDPDLRYRVEGWDGVAWWIDKVYPDGWVDAVMVGDDHRHRIERSTMTPISDDDYCSGCGQIGCGWG